jgi:hypothetical protein
MQLMHAIARESMTIRHMAHTVATRLTPEQRAAIGLPARYGVDHDWYGVIQSAQKRLHASIDAHPYPLYRRDRPDSVPRDQRINRHRRLTRTEREALAELQERNAEGSAVRLQRLDDLMHALIANTVEMARPLLANYTGDAALDGTYTRVEGRNTPHYSTKKAGSTNLEAGLWVRGGNHSASESDITKDANRPAKTSRFKFGFDLEILTMTIDRGAFVPQLILGVNLHKPGAIKDVARTLLPRVAQMGLPAGHLAVDRAYNSLKPEDFHHIALHEGFEIVIDYPKDELGLQENFRLNGVDYIMVDGQWYLGFMPQNLITCTKRNRLDEDDPLFVDDDSLAALVGARETYRLKPMGSRDESGQRYFLPDPAGYIPFDEDGNKIAKPTAKTVKIPLTEGTRWAQKYPYLSPEWRAAYNRRSTVERSNAQLKTGTTSDLDNADKRPGRGHAAHSVHVALLAVAHNVHTLDTFARMREDIISPKGVQRGRRRRRDETTVIPGVKKQRDARLRTH